MCCRRRVGFMPKHWYELVLMIVLEKGITTPRRRAIFRIRIRGPCVSALDARQHRHRLPLPDPSPAASGRCGSGSAALRLELGMSCRGRLKTEHSILVPCHVPITGLWYQMPPNATRNDIGNSLGMHIHIYIYIIYVCKYISTCMCTYIYIYLRIHKVCASAGF